MTNPAPETAYGPDQSPPRIRPDRGAQELMEPSIRGTVPRPTAREFSQEIARWRHEARLTEMTAFTIRDLIAEKEVDYPNSPLWDKARAQMAQTFLDKNLVMSAYGFVCDMSSDRLVAETVFSFANDDYELANYFGLLQSNFRENPARLQRVCRKTLDILIENDPYNPTFNVAEVIVVDGNPNYDPVQSWADSEKATHPKAEWGKIVKIVNAHSIWGEVPARYRQHVMMRHLQVLEKHEDRASRQSIALIDGHLSRDEARYPDVPVWHGLRWALMDQLLGQRRPGLAFDIAVTIKDPAVREEAARYFAQRGHQSEAMRLINLP